MSLISRLVDRLRAAGVERCPACDGPYGETRVMSSIVAVCSEECADATDRHNSVTAW